MLGSPKYLNLTGRMTDTGLEEMLTFLNNVPANFDDLQMAEPKFKAQIAWCPKVGEYKCTERARGFLMAKGMEETETDGDEV